MVDRVFLFWGQSQGISPTSTVVPGYLQASDSGIKIWTGSSWDTLSNGSNNNTFSNNGFPTSFGWEAEFAYRFRQAFPTTSINIFKHTVASTSITYWKPGGTGYVAMKTALATALAALSSPVVEMSTAWIGGTDSVQDMSQANFETHFAAHITGALADLGCSEATRYAIVRLYNESQGGTYTAIRAAQAAIVAADPAARTLINSDSYTLNVDGVHPEEAGCISAGQDVFTSFSSLRRYRMKWGG